ncbi:hypothetical protein Ahy_A02g007895 [Arachis hypogaea]|uniref:Uncharacterized protein n=1 Tax=Arachis hypogaea TaxID=3818 RepID=A0A445EDN3_ARAHY|nr:hypothetical protein Ahy_A02g007895 [Arachis hypogaea]
MPFLLLFCLSSLSPFCSKSCLPLSRGCARLCLTVLLARSRGSARRAARSYINLTLEVLLLGRFIFYVEFLNLKTSSSKIYGVEPAESNILNGGKPGILRQLKPQVKTSFVVDILLFLPFSFNSIQEPPQRYQDYYQEPQCTSFPQFYQKEPPSYHESPLQNNEPSYSPQTPIDNPLTLLLQGQEAMKRDTFEFVTNLTKVVHALAHQCLNTQAIPIASCRKSNEEQSMEEISDNPVKKEESVVLMEQLEKPTVIEIKEEVVQNLRDAELPCESQQPPEYIKIEEHEKVDQEIDSIMEEFLSTIESLPSRHEVETIEECAQPPKEEENGMVAAQLPYLSSVLVLLMPDKGKDIATTSKKRKHSKISTPSPYANYAKNPLNEMDKENQLLPSIDPEKFPNFYCELRLPTSAFVRSFLFQFNPRAMIKELIMDEHNTHEI